MRREKLAFVTSSGGLIGSECARVLCQQGWNAVGIDNDMRSWFLWRGWQHRGVTGPQPSAVELHGYLSYIEMCAVTGRECTIYTKGSIQRYAVLANTGGKRGI